MKRTPLKRKTRLRPVSPKRKSRVGKLGIVRLRGKDLFQLRTNCWIRDLMRCVDCGVRTCWEPRFNGDPEAYDMAHIQSRGAGGSDVLENVVTKCHRCHMKEHAGHKQEGRAA